MYITGTLKASNLDIKQSGASDLRGKLDVDKLTVDLSGASDLMVSGSARQVSIEVSGASDFKGYDLVTEICDARASGASDIKITVNKEDKLLGSTVFGGSNSFAGAYAFA